MQRIVVSLLAVACTLAVSSCERTPARKTVVLYCAADQEYAAPILADFEKTSGIKVLVRYDTEASKTLGLVQKIRAEAARPAADVFWSGEVFHTIRLAQDGLLQPHTSAAVADWPSQFRDKDNTWYGFGLRSRAIAYNTRKVSAEEAPKSLEDVLQPKWRGRVAMARPQFGTTCGQIASWFVQYGPERAAEMLKALKANDVRLVDGNSSAVREVASGKADVCFTDTDDVYAAQRNGMPVDLNLLDQGGRGSLVFPNTAMTLKGAPHPAEAAVLMDYLLSKDNEMAMLRSDSHNWPVRPVDDPQMQKYAITRPLDISYEDVAKNMDLAVKTAGELLY
jgi:iron(III) transport system substrate-binding protein